MAAKKKKAKKSEPRRPKSKLPDIITGRYVVVSGRGFILDTNGDFSETLPEMPNIFVSKTHAKAHVDGLNLSLEVEFEKASKYYGQRFEIRAGAAEGGPDRVFCLLVPKDRARSFKAAVKERYAETHAAELKRLEAESADLDEVHRLALKDAFRTYRERKKQILKETAVAKKEAGAFLASMRKLGG